VILAFVAISIDGGNLLEQRRRSQATADAAALAAAEDLFKKYPTNTGIDVTGTAAAAAKAIAAGNGYNNDGVSSVVTVRTSPQQYTGGPKKNLPIPRAMSKSPSSAIRRAISAASLAQEPSR
jgi:uncharacterized membrane protein